MISQNLLIADAKADLYGTIQPNGWVAILMGETADRDTPARFYQYSSASTLTDDGETVLKPTGVSGAGRWLKCSYQQLQADYSQASSSNLQYILNKPAGSSFATPSRLLSTTGSDNTFTISSTRTALASYIINFAAALTLSTSNGRVTLDYSLDGGTTWKTVASVSQVFSLSLTISTNQDMVLSAPIPAGALVRLNRTNNSGVTITLSANQQEVLL